MSDFKYTKLKEIRKSYGYTQADMAQKLNIARTTYADYEKGRILPPIDKIKRICNVFGLDLSDLTAITDRGIHKGQPIEYDYMPYQVDRAICNLNAIEEMRRIMDHLMLDREDYELLNAVFNSLTVKYNRIGGRHA